MRDWGGLELVVDALREIGAHKLRSLLTLSGIVFGAASVVSMTSLAAAMRTLVFDDLMSMGLSHSFFMNDAGPRSDARGATALRHTGIRLTDLDALRALPGVGTVHGRNFGSEQVVNAPADRRRVRIDGVDAGYLEIRNFQLLSGRTLRPLDIENRSRVAVLGSEVEQGLFGAANPLGQTITIDGVRFMVVGVVGPIHFDIIPADFDWVGRRIYIPYTYMTRYQKGEGRLDEALVTSASTADFGDVLRRSIALLKQRHGGTQDFQIDNEAANVLENLDMADNILGGWNAVMFTIAGVTLIVGGIGLFSVLLISVRERVQEIGIRKALGADDSAILRLFLAESLTLAFLGAVLGIAGGAGLTIVTEMIGKQFGKPFVIPVSVPGVFLAVVFALIVGFLFGWYPARRAARLDPIEAIVG
ncbi:MAG TPA: ABC transporter permease [Gemmatimonadales bacterium]|jgi:putative ABC transport system permease protein